MTDTTRDALERLDREGLEALADPGFREQVRGTPELRARVAALREIDAELSMLADIAPPPASLARAIEAVEMDGASHAASSSPATQRDAEVPEPGAGAALRDAVRVVARGLWSLLAELPRLVWRGVRGGWRALGRARLPLAAGTLLATAAIAAIVIVSGDQYDLGGDMDRANLDAPASDDDRFVQYEEEVEGEAVAQGTTAVVDETVAVGRGPTNAAAPAPPEEPEPALERERSAYRGDGPGRVHGVGSVETSTVRGADASPDDRSSNDRRQVVEAGGSTRDGNALALGVGTGGLGAYGSGQGGGGVAGTVSSSGLAMAEMPEQTIVLDVVDNERSRGERAQGGRPQPGYVDEEELHNSVWDDNGIEATEEEDRRSDLGGDLLREPPMDFETGAAAAFLAERQRVDGLHYRRADGYWANTYVPGDPARAAALQALEQVDAPLARALAESARPMERPFDAPTDASLAVYVHADRRSAQGPTRVLLQVGLQGTEREGARRPAMTGCVVLDLTEQPTVEHAAAMRALLEELARGQEIGDRFCVVVAGREGGVVIPPGELTYGTAAVLAGQFMGDSPVPAGGLDLRAATRQAFATVIEATGEDATLGAGLVWIVTPRSPGSDAVALEQIAHLGAVDGIATSVVGVGDVGGSEALASIARAGQGTRRALADAAGAEDVVEAELLAAGDVVARAARLRIRLAPGVRLVDVVGSYRLDDEQAQRVRDAEQSADARLAAQLGIEADRGEDEDGIQIVIPAFHAGDSHVILLDVVVPGAGPVADVTVRYKDLLWMRNGVARASHALTASPAEPGALEQTVLGSLVDRRVSDALADAAGAMSAGDMPTAVARLEETLALVRGLSAMDDPPVSPVALQADARLLAAYIEHLARRSPDPSALVASLRWAAYRKLLLPTESP